MNQLTRRNFVKVSGVAALGLGLMGCGSSSTESSSSSSSSSSASDASGSGTSVAGLTVAFIPKVTGNAFFESANNGAQKHAESWGFTVDYEGDSTASVSAQVSVINNVVASGVDALCISTVDASGVSDALKSATKSGVTVCTWDSDAKPEDRCLMVSQGTPDILGQMLVDMAVAGLKQRGKNPDTDAINYVWHYSQATVTDQNSWHVAAEKIIADKYPSWVNVHKDNYYSEQDAEKAITVGESILDAYPNIDLIICNDSTALPGQCQAAENKGYNQTTITITGFASPQSMKEYCTNGTLYNWGLWDCGLQGAMGCYAAAYLAAGNTVKVGDKIDIPDIGECEVLENSSISDGATTADKNNGVILLPERLVFTKDNVDDYDF